MPVDAGPARWFASLAGGQVGVAGRLDWCKRRSMEVGSSLDDAQENLTSGLLEVDPVVQHANRFARIEAFPIRLEDV